MTAGRVQKNVGLTGVGSVKASFPLSENEKFDIIEVSKASPGREISGYPRVHGLVFSHATKCNAGLIPE